VQTAAGGRELFWSDHALRAVLKRIALGTCALLRAFHYLLRDAYLHSSATACDVSMRFVHRYWELA
jgi:hypothetical protein